MKFFNNISAKCQNGRHFVPKVPQKRVSKSWYSFLILFFTLCCFSLQSCTDDLSLDNGLNNIGDPNRTFLRIYLPDVEAAAEYGETRDGNEVPNALEDAKEAKINTLYFFAYPVVKNDDEYVVDETSGREAIRVKLSADDLSNKNFNGDKVFEYQSIDINNFQAGAYRMYVLVNLDDYLPDQSKKLSTDYNSMTEDEVRNITFNMSKKYFTYGNLPMACLNDEMQYKKNDAYVKVTNGVFEIENGQNEVYADLTFLCAKVRYTILYDKDVFSKYFPTGTDIQITEETANNVRQQFALADATVGPQVLNNQTNGTGYVEYLRPLTIVQYPDKDKEEQNPYLSDSGLPSEYIKDLPALNPQEYTDDIKRAWQGTLYVTVNELNGDNNTTNLSFQATSSIQSINSNGFKFSRLSADGKLKKGEFYDLLARITETEKTELSVNYTVQPWTASQLAYQLHGPYELVVGSTMITVESNTPGLLWYRSNVAPEDIRFNYPTISWSNKAPVNFYIAEVLKQNGQYVLDENGEYQIQVRVNPRIPPSILESIEKNSDGYKKEDYQFFEIIAGNLQKKIKIEPLKLEPFLRVTPNNVIIDLREYTNSGINNSSLDVLLETNVLTQVYYTVEYSINDGPQMGFNSTTNALALNGGDATISANNRYISLNSNTNIGNLILDIKKILDGDTFWQVAQTITITFTATSGSGPDAITKSDTLKITIKPFTTDYVIHFKAAKGNWTNPHIYVYQCLTMPSNSGFPGKTVGYPTDDNKGNAGLEYIFSNNIAFRGWKGYGGSINPNEPNTTDNPYNAFIYWGGAEKSKQFNAENGTTGNQSIYNYEIDLNSQHDYTQSNCEKCKYYNADKPGNLNGINFKHYDNINGHSKQYSEGPGVYTFPGIAMIPEGDGWFKYTLTGIATPGKAMIMFTDEHVLDDSNSNQDNSGRRYPNGNEVGIPLFDYPDHEGWFYFDGHSHRSNDVGFYDEKEDALQNGVKKYTIYWDNKNTPNWSGNSQPYAYVYEGNLNNAAWPGQPMTRIGNTSIWKIEIERFQNVTFNNNKNGSQHPGEGVYWKVIDEHVYTSDGDTGKTLAEYSPNTDPGTDPEEPDRSNRIYRFWWPTAGNTGGIHLWTRTQDQNNDSYNNHVYTTGNWGSEMKTGEDTSRGYYWREFSPYSEGYLWYILNFTSGNQSTHQDLDFFLQDGNTNYYDAYIESTGGTLKQGKPPVNTTKYYLYFRDENSNYGTPYAHIWNGNSTNGTEGNDNEKMTKLSGPPSGYSGTGTWYQIEIPSSCNGGNFKIYDMNSNSTSPTSQDVWNTTSDFDYAKLNDNSLRSNQNNAVAFYNNYNSNDKKTYVGWYRIELQ